MKQTFYEMLKQRAIEAVKQDIMLKESNKRKILNLIQRESYSESALIEFIQGGWFLFTEQTFNMIVLSLFSAPFYH